MARYDSNAEFDSSDRYDEEEPITIGRRIMAKIKRDDKNLPVANKVDRGDEVITGATGNSALTPATTAKVALFTTANTALRTAHQQKVAADSTAKGLTTVENSKDAIWNAAFEDVLKGIEADTQGDPNLIRSVNLVPYEPGKSPAVGVLSAPQNLHATMGDFPGTTDLHVDRVKSTSSYLWRHTTDLTGATGWVNDLPTTKSSTTIAGLVSGTKYLFQSAVIGSAGQSPWSDPAVSMAA